MFEHRYIDNQTGKIERTDFYFVKLTCLNSDDVFEDLQPKRLFPVTNPLKHIALVDSSEKEVAYIGDLDELDKESAKAVLDCLEASYRIPIITKIVDYEDKGRLYWIVETDMGMVKFHIHNIRYDIKIMGKRVLVRDYSDNRYEIPDYTKLDRRSIKILHSFC